MVAEHESGENMLLGEEKKWVQELDAACRAKGLAPPNKFMLAAWAIQGKGNVKKALKKMDKYTTAVQKYRLDEISADDATQWLRRKWPNVVFYAGQNKDGLAIIGSRAAQMDWSVIESEEDWRYFMKNQHMNLESVSSSLTQIRNGLAVFSNMKGSAMKNYSREGESKRAELYTEAFPIKVKQICLVDPPSFLGVLLKLARLVFSGKMLGRIKTLPSEKIADDVQLAQLPPDMGGAHAEDFCSQRTRFLARHYHSVREVERLLSQ